MKAMTAILTTALLALAPLSQADELARDCIMEGTVKKKQTQNADTAVYVAFHSAEPATDETGCRLDRGRKLHFKEPKNAMIESAPEGSKVRYRYTEPRDSDQEAKWQLIDVSMQ